VIKVINDKTKLIIIFQPYFNLDSLCIRQIQADRKKNRIAKSFLSNNLHKAYESIKGEISKTLGKVIKTMTKKSARYRAVYFIFDNSTTKTNIDNSTQAEQIQDDSNSSLGYKTPGTPDLVEDESIINCNYTSPRRIDSSADFSRY